MLGALSLSLGGFAGGLLSSGSTYGVRALVVAVLTFGALLYLVKVLLKGLRAKDVTSLRSYGTWGTIDADSYTKRLRLRAIRQSSVGVMGRPSIAIAKKW